MPKALRKPSPPKPKVKQRHLTLFLLRSSVKDIKGALDPDKAIEKEYDLPSVGGRLYIGKITTKEPKWFTFVREALTGDEKLPAYKNSTVSAALFFKAKGRWCASTFGFGRYFLKSDSYELDFGLKATLNTIDPARLRTLDMRTFEEATVHTRQQASRNSSLDAFNVDIVRDVLGAVTGEPKDRKFGKRLAGRDALTVDAAIQVKGLPDYGAMLIEAYQSHAYKERFEWVDNIRVVRDAAQIKKLDDRLVQALNERDVAKMHLAPPEMLPGDAFPDFRYPGERMNDDEIEHSDLDLEECLDAIAKNEDVEPEDLQLTIERLKEVRIRIWLPEQQADVDKWPLYTCLVAELAEPDALYVLSAGDWFRIEKTYAQDIGKRLAPFVKDKILPEAGAKEEEGPYNERVASEIGAALIDKKIVKPAGAKSGIEPCDLFTKDSEFVHVKRKTRSSTLSHLFSQGLVAGEAFLRDEKFRAEFRQAVKKQVPSLAAHIKENKRPSAADFGVVFAVIARAPSGGTSRGLPFFSQVNFVRAAERLANFGYRVTLTLVPEKE